MEEIKEFLNEIRNEILTNRTEITSINSTLATIVSTMESYKTAISSVNSRLDVVEKCTSEQLNRINFLERKIIENNIVVIGIPEKNEEDTLLLLKELFDENNISLETSFINDCYRIGRKKGKRPVILKLNSRIKKQEILSNKDNLKSKGISMFSDRTKADRDEFNKFKPHMTRMRSEGKRPKLLNGYLVVDGKKYSLDDLVDEQENAGKSRREEEKSNKGPRSKLQQFAFRPRTSSLPERQPSTSQPKPCS